MDKEEDEDFWVINRRIKVEREKVILWKIFL